MHIEKFMWKDKYILRNKIFTDTQVHRDTTVHIYSELKFKDFRFEINHQNECVLI